MERERDDETPDPDDGAELLSERTRELLSKIQDRDVREDVEALLKRADRANRSDLRGRLRLRAKEQETAAERERREAAERERDEVKASFERAGKPSEAFRIDAELSLALAELKAKKPREQFARLRPHARLDEHGALLIETDDKGLVPVASVVTDDVRDSMGKPGSGGKAPGPIPPGTTLPQRPATRAQDFDPINRQSDFRTLKGDEKRRVLEAIARGER